MKKYITEFIGTFFLILSVVLVSNNNGVGLMAPVAVGLVLMALIYAGGYISGAQYNPAVTLAMLMRGKIGRTDAIYYIVAQVLAAVLGAVIGVFLHQCNGGLEISPLNNDPLCATIAEFLGTFALVYIIMNVAGPREQAGNQFYGLAIGLAASGLGYMFGGLSGGAFNPAVAIGMTLSGILLWNDIWPCLIGSLMGAAVAATIFIAMHKEEEI